MHCLFTIILIQLTAPSPHAPIVHCRAVVGRLLLREAQKSSDIFHTLLTQSSVAAVGIKCLKLSSLSLADQCNAPGHSATITDRKEGRLRNHLGHTRRPTFIPRFWNDDVDPRVSSLQWSTAMIDLYDRIRLKQLVDARLTLSNI